MVDAWIGLMSLGKASVKRLRMEPDKGRKEDQELERDFEREVRVSQWKGNQGEDVIEWQKKHIAKNALCIRSLKCYCFYLKQKVS